MFNVYISVVVTCYNLEKYIAEALNSVLTQDYDKSLYEIIVIDDCSTDESAKIISLFSPIKYIKTPRNQGVLLATVLGIQHAKGEIVAFLDGDDIWRSDKLSRVAIRFQEDPSLVFLTHNYKFINDIGTTVIGQEYTQKVFSQITDQEKISQLIIDGILHRENYVWLGSAYSIRLNPENISSFISWTNSLPNPQLTYQDWPLAFWIASSCCGHFGYDKEPLFSYRIHCANFSGDSGTSEKAIRNYSKAYYTDDALLDIAEKFSCNESVRIACRLALTRSNIILRLFQQPKQMNFIEIFKNWKCFGSFRRGLKEFVRVLIIKICGLPLYFYLKKVIRLTI
jgi:glycosyltransferase involved in cell wall biosynthesis